MAILSFRCVKNLLPPIEILFQVPTDNLSHPEKKFDTDDDSCPLIFIFIYFQKDQIIFAQGII